ncbi:MAG TPA: hypothetical protein PLF03_07545 [Candidatus Omnitrophota bacterium]|nr:hypothetical protein [Candidatus Omnitrophota bacterium]
MVGLIVVIIFIIWCAISSRYNNNRSETRQTPTDTNIPKVGPKHRYGYKPRSSSSSSQKIKFVTTEAKGGKAVLNEDLSGLVDAFTGALLDKSRNIFQCSRCKVFYQEESFKLLQEENSGRCVSCSSTHTIGVVIGNRFEVKGKNPEVGVITLSSYRQYEGRVITFEGSVLNVKQSRRGGDYAVMFEDRSWKDGLKMVVFRRDVQRVGGDSFILNLYGKRVKIRGLLIDHHRFGYEIIVAERSMILSIS